MFYTFSIRHANLSDAIYALKRNRNFLMQEISKSIQALHCPTLLVRWIHTLS